MEEELKLKILMSLCSIIDTTGFISHQIKSLHDYGMPVDNIPKYLGTISGWFNAHKEEMEQLKNSRMASDVPSMFSLDTDELTRFMKSELNGE